MRFGFHHIHHHSIPDRGGGRFGGRGALGWDMENGARGMARGRRRLFDGGELRLVLLRLIGDQPRHGYDLIRAIEERTGGAYAPSPGVVYPTLTLLADMGQIEEQAPDGVGSGNRKLFAVTGEGTRILTEKAGEIDALMARLSALGEMRERTEASSVRRAIQNLRAVLGNRLAGEPDPETIHEIVALIDEAARQIERL